MNCCKNTSNQDLKNIENNSNILYVSNDNINEEHVNIEEHNENHNIEEHNENHNIEENHNVKNHKVEEINENCNYYFFNIFYYCYH